MRLSPADSDFFSATRARLSPIRLSVFSLAPVQAALAPKSPMIEVPWLPRNREVAAGDRIGRDAALSVRWPRQRD